MTQGAAVGGVLLEVTHVFVQRAGKVLVLEREDWNTGVHTWWVPGGLVEPGEDALACAARETLEETALTIGDVTPLYVETVVLDDGRERRDHFFSARCDHDEVRLSHEHVAYRWIAPAAFAVDCWPETDVSALATRMRATFRRATDGVSPSAPHEGADS